MGVGVGAGLVGRLWCQRWFLMLRMCVCSCRWEIKGYAPGRGLPLCIPACLAGSLSAQLAPCLASWLVSCLSDCLSGRLRAPVPLSTDSLPAEDIIISEEQRSCHTGNTRRHADSGEAVTSISALWKHSRQQRG